MWNAGPTPACMIEVISLAGFQDFFRRIADLTAAGDVQPDRFMDTADRYGLPFAEPAWLPEIIERYNLTPPPSP